MKRIINILWMISMVFVIGVPAMAQEVTTAYYVSDTIGSDSNSGTESAPFKTLEKALTKAEAGSTIYVCDNVVVVDATNADTPLVINKNVTIVGLGEEMPTITLRAGGIILGADVTFENIKIGTASYLRPGIAANGYALTLDNVCQDETLRPLQVYGGTFIDFASGTDYGKEVRGEASAIYVTGGSYEAIYAGSANGSIDIPVEICVEKGDGLILGGIYAGSTTKEPDNLATAGMIPVLDDSISLKGTVSVTVKDNAPVKKVDGVSEMHDVILTVNGTGWYSFDVQYVDSITVQGGTFVPTSDSSFGVTDGTSSGIVLQGSATNKATLDLSEMTYNGGTVYVTVFIGSEHGILVLPRGTSMNVLGLLTGGPTELRVGGGMPWNSPEEQGYSGWMDYNTTYVQENGTEESDGTFVIHNPYPTQTDMTFIEDSCATNGWTTIQGSEDEPPEVISFTPKDVTVSYESANMLVDGGEATHIDTDVLFSDKSIDTCSDDLSFVPIDYKVTYTDIEGNVTEGIVQSSVCKDGYYICDYMHPQSQGEGGIVWMKFEPVGSSIYFYKGGNGLAAGNYQVDMTLVTTSGIVTKSSVVTVMTEDGKIPGMHNHEWSKKWNSNEIYHWNECEASDCTVTATSEKNGYESHHGGTATCAHKAVCVDCGATYGEKSATNHTGEAEFRNQKDATETEDGYTGDVYCLGCGELLRNGSVIPAMGEETDKDTSGEPENGANSGQNTDGEDKTESGDGSTETDNEDVITKGDRVLDSASNVMYLVTKVEANGGTVQYKELCSNRAKVTIPNTVVINGKTYRVTSVADKAFKGKGKLTQVKIGDNVKIIGKEAFSGCKNLKTVKLGKNVTTISDKAFYKCEKLTSITIPSKVSKIGKSAFEKCKRLKNITIKTKNLTTKKVGAKAFKGIKSNATIKVPKKKYKAYKSLLKSKGVSNKARIKKI